MVEINAALVPEANEDYLSEKQRVDYLFTSVRRN